VAVRLRRVVLSPESAVAWKQRSGDRLHQVLDCEVAGCGRGPGLQQRRVSTPVAVSSLLAANVGSARPSIRRACGRCHRAQLRHVMPLEQLVQQDAIDEPTQPDAQDRSGKEVSGGALRVGETACLLP